MIALVTDSASMLPDDVPRQFDGAVVPITITIDGRVTRPRRLRRGSSGIVIYEVGPSVGAHTGPGTLGVVYTPI